MAAKAHGGGRVSLAAPQSLAALEARVAACNDPTVAVHRAHLATAGLAASRTTVGRWLLALRPATQKKTLKDDEAESERGQGLARHLARADRRSARRGLRVTSG